MPPGAPPLIGRAVTAGRSALRKVRPTKNLTARCIRISSACEATTSQ